MSEDHTSLVPLLQIYGHTLPVTGIQLGQYSSTLYSCSKDCTVKAWNLHNGTEITSTTMPSPINAMIMVNKSCDENFRTMQKYWFM